MTPFAMMDVLRRTEGDALQALGFGPSECAYRLIASEQCWRLRDYGGASDRSAVLFVAAPIKRPYVWDFTPRVSAVRFCLDQGFHVYLLEWVPAVLGAGAVALDEYADRAIANCIGQITEVCRGAKPVLFGHSLGGTFAAMFTALNPHALGGLVVLGAPLSFKPLSNQLLDVIATIGPMMPTETEIIPGSLLSYASALAWPATFIWSRWMDAAFDTSDRWAMETRVRLERWALDEASLPGKLVYQVLYWLYRDDRFFRGTLKLRGRAIGPTTLHVPMLAVVNDADEIAPLASVRPFIDAMARRDARIITYPGETGVALQHLGVLVGRRARAHVWPEILSWLRASGISG